MSKIITLRFGTNEVRDLSDGKVPVEVWCVEQSRDTEEIDERHISTPQMRHTIQRHVRRAAGGIQLGWNKWIELRTPEDRCG